MTHPSIALVLPREEGVKEQAAWALGNIAGDSPSSRNVVLRKKNALENMVLSVFAEILKIKQFLPNYLLTLFIFFLVKVALALIVFKLRFVNRFQTSQQTLFNRFQTTPFRLNVQQNLFKQRVQPLSNNFLNRVQTFQ